jgi:NAD-dependent deacetylase
LKTIFPNQNEQHLPQAAARFTTASRAVALTGAGISVGSGIADFRSPGGLWSIFSPDEYATLEVFLDNPQKAWQLYREMGRSLLGKKPNRAHRVLAELEGDGLLKGVITQNVDNLHQAAGSRKVLEIHGDHQHLHCLQCGHVTPVTEDLYHTEGVPACHTCSYPYKPNVVLFGESVRSLHAIEELLTNCDLLLVIGTSAQVYPAAGFPELVKQQGGLIYEFNQDQALSVPGSRSTMPLSDFFFQGDLAKTLPMFGEAVQDAKKQQ